MSERGLGMTFFGFGLKDLPYPLIYLEFGGERVFDHE